MKKHVYLKFLKNGQVKFFVTPIDEYVELMRRLWHGCIWSEVWLGKSKVTTKKLTVTLTVLFDDVECETKYDCCEHKAEHQKRESLTDSQQECATTRTLQRKNEAMVPQSFHGGDADLAFGAVHCERHEIGCNAFFATLIESKDSGC